MKHFYKIGGHVLCATKQASELNTDSLGEYKKMVFTDDTVVRVVKDGDKIK